MKETLQKFKDYLEVLAHYEHVVTQLQWDMQTQTPKKGYGNKVEVMTYFSSEAFKMQTADEYGQMLNALSAEDILKQLDEGMRVTVTRRKKRFEEDKRIPHDFYEEMVRAHAHSEKAWEEAKKKGDYSIFEPHLQKMIDYSRQLVGYTKPDMDVYDAMLDMYEEGVDSETVDKLFAELKDGLVSLLKKIAQKPEPDAEKFKDVYDINKQKEWCEFLLDYIGFDMEAGVMGESAHPFTTGFGPRDVRVTNHYSEKDPIDAMYSMIHEGGHGIFEQGVAECYENTDVAKIDFLGLHESQSRFYENILGRNINFWKPIYEKLGEYLPKFKEISLNDFYKEINHVVPSCIRTMADEVTYSLHIILRYELEKAIFREGVKASELPEMWNDKMEELIGVRPSNDTEGILQDIHWAGGAFGYFPTYALGNIYDGMFLEAATEELGDIDTILAEGRVKDITKWLHDKIHQFGSLRNAKEVIEHVCGKEITAKPILKYFEEKYAKLYELN